MTADAKRMIEAALDLLADAKHELNLEAIAAKERDRDVEKLWDVEIVLEGMIEEPAALLGVPA